MRFRTNLPVPSPFLRGATAAALFLFCSAAQAQDRPQDASGDQPRVSIVPRLHREGKTSDLRVDVNVVQIPVTVTDPSGTPVTGLSGDHFKVFEDGVEQPLARISNQDAPISLGIIFDASASMDGKLNNARQAVAQLAMDTVKGDEFFVIRFSDAPKLIQEFTTDPTRIGDALKSIRADGWTALFDAIRLSVDEMRRARNTRHALVILSDGADNNSRFTQHEIIDLLRESDVIVYAIAINGPMVAPASFKVLKKLAESTGGRMYQVNKVSQLPDAAAKINRALRDQYTLAYYPTNKKRDGKYRRILVKIIQPFDRPSLRASWRSGYYAP
jgi:Ca-activated chloride channel family protein